jgi:hypothetical protein
LLDQKMKSWRLQRHADTRALSPEAGSDQRIESGGGRSTQQTWIRFPHRGEIGDEAVAIETNEGAMRSGF